MSLIDKLRKLRALSTSANVHEAAAAAAAAARLVQEHNISEAELDTQEVDEPVNTEILDMWGQQEVTWKTQLGVLLMRNNGCRGYTTTKNGKRSLAIVGRPSDVNTVRYLYAWLTLELTRLNNQRGRTARNSFFLGAVSGIRGGTKAAVAAVPATSAALARIDSKMQTVNAAMPSNLRKGQPNKSRLDANAYTKGVQAGHNIHQGAALSASHGGRLLT